MRDEIKARIAQINAGTAPAGYKKTKVGIVPEEWDIIKLSSISTHKTEKNKDMKFTETYTNSATQGIIRQTDYFDKQISNNDNIDGYYIVCENDYVYNPRISVSAPCGPISKSHISETGIMSPLYTVFRLNAEYEYNAFIEYYFKSPFWHRYMTSIANYGARHDRMNITNADLFGMPIPVPPLPEQQKIAEILTAQDAVIALMQKQIELLQKQKKAFLQKMFPKKGCNVPEIRFAGFTDAWEQREFKNITFPSGVKNKENLPYESYSVTNENGFIPQNEQFENGGTMATADKTMYYIVTPNSFAYNPARINVGSIGYYKGAENVIVSSLYEVFQTTDEIDDRFLWHWFKSEKFQRMIEQYQEGGVRLYFYYDKLCMCSISAPKIEEQRKIGAYFDTLDTLITLHQRKLEIEQQKKKALMQLLLSGKVRVESGK